VGPKINELFKDSGLKTFTQVGGATVKEMRAILNKGGARYRMANPSTWAKQATLAANNKWKELKKLQDELSGGEKK
jgi:predicted flap endonuclease-1-like 5' DNA nuclease